MWKQALPEILPRQTLTLCDSISVQRPACFHLSGRSHYPHQSQLLPDSSAISQGKTHTRWHCVSDKSSAKTKRSGRGSGSNQAPSALNCTRKPRLRSSLAWTWGKWFSSQRERTSVTGLPSTWWISLTGSTWSTARWASSAPSAPVPSCRGGWGTSTGGKMGTSTRNPPSSLPWSTWTCWWTGSSRSSIMRTSSPPE